MRDKRDISNYLNSDVGVKKRRGRNGLYRETISQDMQKSHLEERQGK